MPVSIELSAEHAVPLAVAFSSAFVMAWAGVKVGQARKKYNVKYPTMYAVPGIEGITKESADHFNCAQRAHQNLLENWPQLLVLLTVGSVFPDRALYAGICGGIRVAGFIAYNTGYRTGDPKKRSRGFFGYLGLLGLLILSVETISRVASS